MKNLLAFLGAAVLVFVGVALYLNWFPISRGPTVAGHKTFNVEVNTDKIKSDVEKGGEKVLGAIERARQEAAKKADAGRTAVVGDKMESKTPDSGKGDK